MGVPSYLLKKQDTYYFRQVCDRNLKEKLGKREIIKSLGVKDKSVAIRIAREFKVTVDFLADCLSSDESCEQNTANQYLENNLNSIISQYLKTDRNYSIITSFQRPFPSPTLQVPRKAQTPPVAPSQYAVKTKKKTALAPLFEKFSAEKFKLKQWTTKTQRERTAHFYLISDLLKYIKKAKTFYLEEITKEDVRELKDLLLILPKNHVKRFPNIKLPKLIEYCISLDRKEQPELSSKYIKWMEEKISISTIADKYVSTIKAFWNWLNDQDYTDSRVFDILKYDCKKTVDSWKTYTAKDLNNLFNDDVFTHPNPKLPYQYFIPIISLYTSCRLQEICQLRVSDVDTEDGINVIRIMDSSTTSVKTANSERSIPIHNDLISCGFIDFVNDQKAKGEFFVFPELKSEEASTNVKRVSKWFNERYRVKKGFGKGYSFHSLRRTFINEMSRNGASDADIREIIGHKPIKSDTLNIHYKDEMTINQKNQLLKQYIRYDECNFPWLDK